MTDLRAAASAYLALRRAMGFRLVQTERLLGGFVGYLQDRGIGTITTSVAVEWATLPSDTRPWWWRQRLSAARGFARYLQAFDPATEVPPAGLIRAPAPRAVPYLFSDADITALMAAAERLRPQLRAATCRTLIGLLAVTGMRASEALALDTGDVDLAEGVILIRHAKFGKSRELILHPTTIRELSRYEQDRQLLCPRPRTPAFFLTATGARLYYETVNGAFHRLAHVTGLTCPDGRLPRLHDLRHSFAVSTLAGWHAGRLDAGPRLPALSAYLGHTDPEDTYWYLSAAMPLLGQAARRLEQSLERAR